MKRLLIPILTALLLLPSCADADVPAETSADTLPETEAPEENFITVAARGEESDFRIVSAIKDPATDIYSARLMKTINNSLGVKLDIVSDYPGTKEQECEILIGSTLRTDYTELVDTLSDDEYAIKCLIEEGKQKIIIAYKGTYALMCAIDRFTAEYVSVDRIEIPKDLNIKGSFKEEDAMIVSSIEQLRDPCVLVEDDAYYIYGTGWVCYKNTSGSLDGEWISLGVVAEKPAEADNNFWAPEVHKYNGAYYMFTTYHSSVTNHRGCTIMKSDRPEGPFREITNGQITPHDWDCIDGTFYVDEDGQPWMVFVHEWTSTDDGIGRMAAAKLSDDLTHFISEPIELFRADDPAWSRAQVTDGCWMYRTEDGQLLMIWSNSDKDGYCVGIARSKNGKIDGEWTHDSDLLYSKGLQGKYDGGHGMIFYDRDGQMYLSIHSPNKIIGDRKETPVFLPIREQNGTLVWQLWKK
jgi:GH43 family beta-xylosidase